MSLPLHDVARISRAFIAAHHADRVEIYGVSPASNGPDYADVLVTVKPAPAGDRRRKARTVLAHVRTASATSIEDGLRQCLALALDVPTATGAD